MKKRKMPWATNIILALVMVSAILVAACGGNDSRAEINALKRRVANLEELAKTSAIFFRPDGQYDFNNYQIDFEGLNQLGIAKSLVKISVSTPITKNGKPDTIEKTANGILLANGYVLTFDFLITYFPPEPVPPPPGEPDFPVEWLPPTIIKTGDDICVIGENIVLEKIFSDRRTMIALLRVPADTDLSILGYEPLPIKIGQDLELTVGHYLHTYGLLNGSLFFRDSRIEGIELPKDVELLEKYEWFGVFIMTRIIFWDRQGILNSQGSPVIAFRDGSPELIGAILMDAGDGYTWGFRMTRILSVILQKTGIDLKQIHNDYLEMQSGK